MKSRTKVAVMRPNRSRYMTMSIRLKSVFVAIVLPCACMTVASVHGAEFRSERSHVSITGAIQTGDLVKFRSFLKAPDALQNLLQGAVALDSPGGDVAAALVR